MMEAGWSARRAARQSSHTDCVLGSSDDNRVRVWRLRGKHLNPAFALQRNSAPTAGVTVWGVIAKNTLSPLVLIRSPTWQLSGMFHDILQPHELPLRQRLPWAIFQYDNVRPHKARMSQDYIRTVTTLPWPA
ncbi:transposable element Tcb2 transposase [Trichonephila clavipes]|nr:transposable element Tcb2 transposase [Trichonephila clavipes]